SASPGSSPSRTRRVSATASSRSASGSPARPRAARTTRTWRWRSRPRRRSGRRARSGTTGGRGAGPDGRAPSMTNLEALRQGMVGDGPRAGWRETIGARIAEVDEGRVVVELDADAKHRHEGGVVQGGIITQIADA